MSIRLMTRVWDDTRLRGTELLILLCLADHANDHGTCWPSVATIARRARCSERQAFRHIANLEKQGFIRREMKKPVRGNKWVNFYRVLPAPKGMNPGCLFDGDETDVMDDMGQMSHVTDVMRSPVMDDIKPLSPVSC